MSGFTHVPWGKDIVYVAVVLKTVLLRVVVSIYVMKILAKESKLLSLCPLQFHGFVGSAFH